MRKRYIPVQKRWGKKIPAVRIRPGADSELKNVFASIGVPEQAEFKPDPFQLNAIEAIEKADCLVTAPTGAGKTWIAVQSIAKVLQKRKKVLVCFSLKSFVQFEIS
uniref:DEAD/DEAH-box helicase domain-containing protein n=1 Tax=uncultured Desulfobacterium sp. TaxID=201089 RepID=E1YCD0_9BACT|nr:hypothetical protein N47_G35480 [uncultured Desulfobacterium sp.]